MRYLVVLHLDESYGNAFAEGITLAAKRDAEDMSVVNVPLSVDADNSTVAKAVLRLKESEYMYFFCIIYPDDLVDRVMAEAYRQGIAGTGLHTWLFSDSAGTAVTRRDLPLGSPLERAYRGTGMLSATGGLPGMDKFDRLSAALEQLGAAAEEDRAPLDARWPRDVDRAAVVDADGFLATPGLLAPFLFDAVVALGLAACRLVAEADGPEGEEYFGGEELFRALLDAAPFEGTSGRIVLDPETGTRDPRSALFSLTNFVPDAEAAVDPGMVRFTGTGTDLYMSGEWDKLAPYIFNDGTTETPLDLPVLHTNGNYLSTGLKAVCYTLCAIIIVLALGFSVWTYTNSKRRIVASSQPLFLYIIVAGTLLMGEYQLFELGLASMCFVSNSGL